MLLKIVVQLSVVKFSVDYLLAAADCAGLRRGILRAAFCIVLETVDQHNACRRIHALRAATDARFVAATPRRFDHERVAGLVLLDADEPCPLRNVDDAQSISNTPRSQREWETSRRFARLAWHAGQTCCETALVCRFVRLVGLRRSRLRVIL